MTDSFFSYQIPNLIMAAAMYTLIGRYVLSLFFAADSDATIWRVFQQITDPILHAVAFVTPRIVPLPLVALLAVVWLLALRVVFFLVAIMFGFAPRVGG
jgi:uncharacterized protein YggT (Ycf19 family)